MTLYQPRENITAINEDHEITTRKESMVGYQIIGYDHGSVQIRTSSNFLRKG